MNANYRLSDGPWTIEHRPSDKDDWSYGFDSGMYHHLAWALSVLRNTEGLAPVFYYCESDYLDAVVEVYKSTPFYRSYGDGTTILHIPLHRGHVVVDVTDYAYRGQ